MELNSLLVCSDERALRVLRSVLSELEIHVEHCADNASAAKKLTQQSFEAVIIDCKDERSFGLLRRVRSVQQNSKSVAIAIIDARTNLQTAFKLGANFVVYEPISAEKAKSSFRAARALMKRERRRSMRLEVNIPAYFRFQNGDGENASISGVSEGGISVRFSGSVSKKSGVAGFCFALPDSTTVIEATGTIAWQDSRRRAGIEFATLSDGSKQSLKEWLLLKCEEKHDPPIRCSLTAISSGGCFLRTQSPFPAHTRVVLLLQVTDRSVKTEGKVRFMDPDLGMGIEFMTAKIQRNRLKELIERITAHPESVAEVLVEPEGIDWDDDSAGWSRGRTGSPDDGMERGGLLELFRTGAALPREQFLLELEKHQLASASQRAAEIDPNEPAIQHRREPRLAVSLPVEMWGQDHQESSAGSLVDVSHRGARIDGVAFNPKVGEVVHLVSNGCESRFLVIWIGEPGTAREGQIGLQGLG
ncbi:MAG: PilZ domain-containing protein [Candidatus Sulfotelmatobacter sp.]